MIFYSSINFWNPQLRMNLSSRNKILIIRVDLINLIDESLYMGEKNLI